MTAQTDDTTRAGRLRPARALRQATVCQNGPVLALPGPSDAVGSIAALLALRDEVISPILAGIRSPRHGRKPSTWTAVDRHDEALRIEFQHLFRHLHLETGSAAAQKSIVDLFG
jgi:hypothetical protein